MGRGLGVHRDDVRPGAREVRHLSLGAFDHQVDVKQRARR
jgi:hypothetical protein